MDNFDDIVFVEMAKSLNGQPIQMNVEVLVVTDSSALQSHQIYAGIRKFLIKPNTLIQ